MNRLTRRQFLRRTATFSVAAAGIGPLLAACGVTPAAQRKQTQAVLPLVLQSFPTPAAAMRQVLGTYKNEYHTPAEIIAVASDYYTVSEARLSSGHPPFDVLQMDPGFLTLYQQKGWIRDIEGLPGLDELKRDMVPSVLAQMKGTDGKMYCLPYYVGLSTMFYNAALLTKAGLKPASSWSELIDQCQYLKAKGWSDAPFIPVWTEKYNLIAGHFEVECLSRGMSSMFDTRLEPLWDKDPVALEVLQFWAQLQQKKLVPVDALTIDHLDDMKLMGTGNSAYFYFNSYALKQLNDPHLSPAAGHFHVSMMPGRTHRSENFASVYFLTKRNPSRDLPWTLMRFVGGTDKNGRYVGPTQIAVTLGLLFAYRSMYSDQAILKAWSTWANSDDIALFNQQLENSVSPGPAQNTSWYSQYQTEMASQLQQFLAGQKTAEQALHDSAAYVRQLVRQSS